MSGAPLFPVLAGAYLIGSIPFGVIVGRTFFRQDLRASGSGNIGAANALRTLGRKAGAAVLMLDALKGVAAVLLAADRFLPAAGGAVALAPLAGAAAILGHCYSPWLRLRGGKGVATFLGATFALSWEAGLAFVAIWLALALPSGYSSLGSLCASVAAAAVVVVTTRGASGWSVDLFAILSLALILWRHRANVARIRAGTESRLMFLRGRTGRGSASKSES